jgi:phage shock protein B
MEEIIIPIVVVGMLFIGLPWIIFHYITRWKANASLTAEDENLLDELYELSRRLDERMNTIERIIRADNPNWNALAYDRDTAPQLEKQPRDLPLGEMDLRKRTVEPRERRL